MKLTKEDYAALERSWITRQIANGAGLYRVLSLDGKELVGRNGCGDFSGMVFPYRRPGTTSSVMDRLRLDNPPIDAATGKPQQKYLSHGGDRNRLYFPPCDPVLLADVTMPMVVTEGEKKVLALWRAALESNGAGGPAFLPVGPPGVWNWKGTTGIRTNAKGERVQEKGVIPDFDIMALKDRKVTILFDANAATNTSVQSARKQLARELTLRGAEVRIADLPPLNGVNGVDDLLGLYGLEKAMQILKSAVRYDWRQDLIKTGKEKDKIAPVLANAITALRGDPEWHGVLAYDEHALRISARRETPWGYAGPWREQDDRLLTDWLQHHGIMVPDSVASKAAEAVAEDHIYHPVREHLDSLVWDKKPRIDKWLVVYLGAKDSDLARAFGPKWLISAVARIYEPGCKADCCLIAEGEQGSLKSTAFRIIGEPWFTDDISDLGCKDSILSTIGAWIIELSELNAMSRAELTAVKAFMSRNTDRFRPPYGRRMIESPRQCVFCGTVNLNEYLRDETGGRRFWPFQCGKIDLPALRRDKPQLWAEAVARYREGEHWWLETEELNTQATEEQVARYVPDPWEQIVAAWLAKEGIPDVSTAEVLMGAIEKKKDQLSRPDQSRVGAILRRLKWESFRPDGDAPRLRRYRPSNAQSKSEV